MRINPEHLTTTSSTRLGHSMSRSWFDDALSPGSEVQELAQGDVLFAQGAPAAAIFSVESGRVRLIRRTIDDHLVVLHTARAGELLAEAALFAGAYHCEAIADIPTRVRRYSKRQVLGVLRCNADFSQAFMARLALQVQGLRLKLELRNIRSARQRVLHHLLLTAGPDGRNVAIDVPLQDMAADLGLTREAFYRTLAALEAAGTIARTDRAIILRKPVAD